MKARQLRIAAVRSDIFLDRIKVIDGDIKRLALGVSYLQIILDGIADLHVDEALVTSYSVGVVNDIIAWNEVAEEVNGCSLFLLLYCLFRTENILLTDEHQTYLRVHKT